MKIFFLSVSVINRFILSPGLPLILISRAQQLFGIVTIISGRQNSFVVFWTIYFEFFPGLIVMFNAGVHFGWPSPSLPKLMSSEYVFNITSEEASYITIIGKTPSILSENSMIKLNFRFIFSIVIIIHRSSWWHFWKFSVSFISGYYRKKKDYPPHSSSANSIDVHDIFLLQYQNFIVRRQVHGRFSRSSLFFMFATLHRRGE